MKKVLLLLLGIFLLSGCVSPHEEALVNDTDMTKQAATIEEENTDAVDMKANGLSWENAKILKIHDIYEISHDFHNPNGVGFDELFAFNGDTVIFAKDSDKEIVLNDNEYSYIVSPTIYTYDISIGMEKKITEYRMLKYGAFDRKLLDERYVIYSTGSDASEKNTDILITDLVNKETFVADSILGYFPTFSILNNVEFIYYDFYNDEANLFRQRVCSYNIQSRTATELIRNITDLRSETPKEIYAVDSDNEKIYILFHELKNDEVYTYIEIYDHSGNMIQVTDYIELGIRKKVDGDFLPVTSMKVYGDYVFFEVNSSRVYGFAISSNTLTQIYGKEIVEVTANNISYVLENGNYEKPKSQLIDNRYLICEGYSNEKEILVIDFIGKETFRIKPEVEDFTIISDFVVNESGDCLLIMLDKRATYNDKIGEMERPNIKYLLIDFKSILDALTKIYG